jgi:hypothetical protein
MWHIDDMLQIGACLAAIFRFPDRYNVMMLIIVRFTFGHFARRIRCNMS